MAINAVQFQKGLSMAEFMQHYGTEAQCYRALYWSRWPQGLCCPVCHERRRSRFGRGRQVYYPCCACRHQTTLLSGTLLESTKLPLRTWMLAIHLLTTTKTNLSALELMRHLGVNYKAAWRIKHKVMQAMATREESRQLKGFVQIDDAYLGGERNGGKPWRGSENKQPFLIAVQTDETLEHRVEAGTDAFGGTRIGGGNLGSRVHQQATAPVMVVVDDVGEHSRDPGTETVADQHRLKRPALRRCVMIQRADQHIVLAAETVVER